MKRIGVFNFWILIFLLAIVPQLKGQDDKQADEKAAGILAQTATNAQNEGDFEFAAEKWEALIQKYPNSSLIPEAQLYCGICYATQQDYAKAVDKLKAAIPQLTGKAVKLPQAKLYLGFSQLELGVAAGESGDREKQNQFCTTAAQTLGQLVKDHPEYEEVDQANFFQAQAFEQLDRLDEALAAYQQAAKFPKSKHRYETLLAIGELQQNLGRPAEARQTFALFREEAEAAGGHPLLLDNNFGDVLCLMMLAKADLKQQDAAAAKEKFQQALDALEKIASDFPTDESGVKPYFTKSAIKYEQAYCLGQLDRPAEAAQLYLEISQDKDFERAGASLAYAGNLFLQAGKLPEAETALKQVVEANQESAALAAHRLARDIYLTQKKYQPAYDLAARFSDQTEDLELKVALKMDQADAAYELGKPAEALNLFATVAKDFPDHPSAPAALYNVSFISLEQDQPAEAIKAAETFIEKYPDNEFHLADVYYLKAESLLDQEQLDAAAQAYADLTGNAKFQQDARMPGWKLRSAIPLFLSEKYQPVVDLLQPLAPTLNGQQQAEAYHWLGLSQFNLDRFAEAEAALSKVTGEDSTWQRTDEALTYLIGAQLKQDNREAAGKSAQSLATRFPKSTRLSDAFYQLGAYDLDQEQYGDALASFNQVIDNHPQASQLPLSLFNAAACQIKLKDDAAAEKLYSRFISEFPDHELVKSAKLYRASVQRRSGQGTESIAEMKKLLETDLKESDRVMALYQLGLAQVDNQQWDEAVKTFQALTEIAADNPQADRYYYELAWAHRENKSEPAAIAAFATIAKDYPDSSFATEANFHVGNDAYNQEKFDAAIEAFQQCVESTGNDAIREKAAYKLGWSYYKQDQFESAHDAFTKQVHQFENGDLVADGLFMVAETLFRQKNYEAAYEAYLLAGPAVKASQVVAPKLKWLVMLHGAQAANKSKQYTQALELASGIEDSDADRSLKQDVYLEIGTAYSGLKNSEQALDYWQRAADGNLTKTGARASCMIGDEYFREKKFKQASDKFKEVWYGFGGTNAAESIKPWQAYALYETARSHYVQIQSAPDDQKLKLVDEAIKYFEKLIEDYQDDALVPSATEQLEKLRQQRSKLAS